MKPERSKGRKSATNKPAPSIKKWSVEETEVILDYLHGDVPRDEAKPCCYYEYARTSEVFQRARQEYDPDYADDSIYWIVDKFRLFWNDWRRLQIVICPGYPKLPWRDLSKAQGKKIAEHFVKTRPLSLIPSMTESFVLDSQGIFDRFKEQAASDLREWKKHPRKTRRARHYPAIVGDHEIKYVVLPINYAEGKHAANKAFSLWLDSKANKKLFKKYDKKRADKQKPDPPDRYNELLKFLAAWRLYDELGLEAAQEWTRKNRRQDQRPEVERIKLRAFFREKPEKTTEADKEHFGKQFFGPLYRDGRDWEKAIAKAESFLAREIELGQSAADVG